MIDHMVVRYLRDYVNKHMKVLKLQQKNIKIQFPLRNIKQNFKVNNKHWNN